MTPAVGLAWTDVAADPKLVTLCRLITALLLSFAVVLALLYGAGFYLPGEFSAAAGVACMAPTGVTLLKRDVRLFGPPSMFGLWYSYATLPLWLHQMFPASYVSYHSRQFQTDGIFAQVGHLVLIGWFSFQGGSRVGEWLSRTAFSRSLVRALPSNSSLSAFGGAVCCALLFGALVFPTQPVWVAGYRRGSGIGSIAEGMQLNTIKAGGYLFLLLALVVYTAKPARWRAVALGLVSASLIVGAGFFGGNRVEEIGYVLAVAGILSFVKNARKIPRVWMLAGVAILIVLILTGVVRGVLPELLGGAVSPDLISGTLLTALPSETDRYIQLGTAGDVIGTMSSVVGMLESGSLQHEGGSVFWNYLRRTLPTALDPGRPRQLQEQLSDWRASNGGLFVLAEPYQAWGAMGVVGALCLTGMLMGYADGLRYGAGGAGHALLFCNAVLVFSMPRMVLYGAFNLYKFGLTAVACLFMVMLLSSLARRMALGLGRG